MNSQRREVVIVLYLQKPLPIQYCKVGLSEAKPNSLLKHQHYLSPKEPLTFSQAPVRIACSYHNGTFGVGTVFE